MSVRPSVRLKLKISVTTELIGFYSSGYIPTGPVVVLGYFLRGWDTPTPLLGQSPLEARGESASSLKNTMDQC